MEQPAKRSILALEKKPDGSFRAHSALGSFTFSSEDLLKVLCSHIVVLEDGKLFLQDHALIPSPSMRILCLKTINQILPQCSQINNASSSNLSPEIITDSMFSMIEKWDIYPLINIECQLIPVVVSMQQKGIPFLKQQWQENLLNFEEEAKALKTKLSALLKKEQGFALFEEEIDLNNSVEVKTALEKAIGFKLASTSQSSLNHIDHEAAKLLINYRLCERMLNTYGDHFLTKVVNDRLRGEFSPIGSSSGRFSCHEPNLLALPNHPKFQACLTPKKPYKLLRFDYGAFELRILAALSQDKALLDIFDRELDIHSMVAEAVFGEKVSKNLNPQLREQAKIISFGLIYGMKEHSLSKQLNISLPKAQAMLARYFKKFSRVGEFLHELEETAFINGYARTSLGRIAFLDTNPKERAHVARLARNLPIQGTGADIIKLAMCRVYKQFYQQKIDAHLINVIHDELVIEASAHEEERVKSIVQREMELAHAAILPGIRADISIK